MYSNRRREHIHIIKQFDIETEKYTGTRIVIFKKDGLKYIKDYDNFIKHRYKNPKSKIHNKSLWIIKNSNIPGVIKKEMVNRNEEETLKMKHILYESPIMNIKQYYEAVFKEEEIRICNDVDSFF